MHLAGQEGRESAKRGTFHRKQFDSKEITVVGKGGELARRLRATVRFLSLRIEQLSGRIASADLIGVFETDKSIGCQSKTGWVAPFVPQDKLKLAPTTLRCGLGGGGGGAGLWGGDEAGAVVVFTARLHDGPEYVGGLARRGGLIGDPLVEGVEVLVPSGQA